MTHHHEEPIPTENSFILDESSPVKTEPVNITIKVYLYGEEACADTYQFQD